MLADLWALPAPFDLLAISLRAVATAIVATAVRITGNVGELGPWWAVAYWPAVGGLWTLGGWGLARISQARRGNDYLEFAGQRASWAGPGVKVFQWVIQAETTVAALAFTIGYLGAVLLLIVGLLWRWLAAVAGAWLVLRALQVRRARNLTRRTTR